ncbi:MAG: endonuclease [Bacteroidales bacterium]|nr:endonuclease [Bacteroidales bacterium]
MRKVIICSLIFLVFSMGALAQKNKGFQFKVAFYNTENLFDTIDDPHKSDNDFLPTSKVPWTSQRYFLKLDHIARALASIDSIQLPAIIGLAEIENMQVLQDLIHKTRLQKGNYQGVLEEGKDPRGIDVALIYRKDIFKCLGTAAFPSAANFKTRLILYVKLEDAKKDTFHLFVNHWKSREGGAEGTEGKRIENAQIMRHLADSIFGLNSHANIILVGDFNDEPSNKSIAETLNAKAPGKKPISTSLYNLLYRRQLDGEGTLYYKDWDVFDQIIVSGNLLAKKRGKGPTIMAPYSYIFTPEWLLYKQKNGMQVPNRTASGKEYFGGYSDHLPVYTIVVEN